MADTYGYIRVSSKDQNEERQISAMAKKGIFLNNIFIEKTSGKTFNRTAYNKLLKTLKPDDTLHIGSIDRLGRDYDGILEEWRKLTKEKRIIIKVLDTPILDTDKNSSSLVDKFIKDITLLSLAFNAEQEWHNIKARQADGIANAKSKGKHLGRPKAKAPYTKHDFLVIGKWKNQEISKIEAINELGKGRTTFYKLVKMYEQKRKDGEPH